MLRDNVTNFPITQFALSSMNKTDRNENDAISSELLARTERAANIGMASNVTMSISMVRSVQFVIFQQNLEIRNTQAKASRKCKRVLSDVYVLYYYYYHRSPY